MPLVNTSTEHQVHQLLASREASPQVTETCLAQGLNLNRLNYVKWLVANGRLLG
jgi:hypothetical protein